MRSNLGGSMMRAIVWVAVEQVFGCRSTLRSLQKQVWTGEQWQGLALRYVRKHETKRFLKAFRRKFYSVAMTENIFIHTLNLIDY